MILQERIKSFAWLGQVILEFLEIGEKTDKKQFIPFELVDDLANAISISEAENRWFIRDNIYAALRSISGYLTEEKLNVWVDKYRSELEENHPVRTVAVIMAGNIPLVGFHDFLCVLISGNRFLGKLSSSDKRLLPVLASILAYHVPEWSEFIDFTTEPIRSFDLVIATGSNTTSHYFEFYFSKYPHIIRKNRNSIAILTGQETEADISGLSNDVFQYFGLGCRNVSKIYVPENYDFSQLLKVFSGVEFVTHHNKYRNNFDYFKAIFQLNLVPYIDAGSIILKEEPQLSSPVSVLNYQYYSDWNTLIKEISAIEESVQCVLCTKEVPFRWVMPGNSQVPELFDYADGVDTMQFLIDRKSHPDQLPSRKT